VQKQLSFFSDSFRLVTGVPPCNWCTAVGNQRNCIVDQFRVRGFYESKILFAGHRLQQSLLSWERFSIKEVDRLVRRFVENYYAEAGWYLGSKLVFDEEPLDSISLPPNEYEKFLGSVGEIFPTVRYVFMVRSPEAVVSSMVNREWGIFRSGNNPEKSERKGGNRGLGASESCYCEGVWARKCVCL